MKKWLLVMVMPLLLWGCGAEETFETIADEQILPVMATPRQICVELPQDTVAPVLTSENEQIYLCDDHEIILETLPAGDLRATIRAISGHEKEDLTVMQTQWDTVSRYEFVWTAMGERGQRLGRAVILDDGQYHYCMSVLEDTEGKDSKTDWNPVFSSFGLG